MRGVAGEWVKVVVIQHAVETPLAPSGAHTS